VVHEGSLDFQMLTDPGGVEVRFQSSPADVLRELLREEGRPLDERTLRARLTGKLGLSSKAVAAGLPRGVARLQADPHVQFAPEYERPCYAWSDEELPSQPHAYFERRPWRYLASELPARKLTDAEHDVLRQRVEHDQPTSFPERLCLAVAGLVDMPVPDEILNRTRRPGTGTGLARLPDPTLRAIYQGAHEMGRRDLLWMLVLVGRKSAALKKLPAELVDEQSAPYVVAVVEALALELRSLTPREAPAWWVDVVARLPRLTSPRLAAAMLTTARVVRGSAVRDALVGAVDPSGLLELDQVDFGTVFEAENITGLAVLSRQGGFPELATRFAAITAT
jgi:hypothetical protein